MQQAARRHDADVRRTRRARSGRETGQGRSGHGTGAARSAAAIATACGRALVEVLPPCFLYQLDDYSSTA